MKNLNLSVKLHDLFQVGSHRVICDDARDPKAVKRLVGGDKITSVVCDPPFGVDVNASKAGFKQKLSMPKDILNDHLQSDAEYQEFSKKWLEAVIPHLARKNSMYVFNADRMVFALRQAMMETGCKVSQMLIWIKSQAVVGRLDYNPRHELILYAWYGIHQFLKSKDQSTLFFPKPSKSKLHPTMKPIPLIRHLILNSSKVNDVIFDNFLGSGTALMAAEQTKRRCMAMELDPEYCKTALQRFYNIFGVMPQKIN
jgi:DNA modification methylase